MRYSASENLRLSGLSSPLVKAEAAIAQVNDLFKAAAARARGRESKELPDGTREIATLPETPPELTAKSRRNPRKAY